MLFHTPDYARQQLFRVTALGLQLEESARTLRLMALSVAVQEHLHTVIPEDAKKLSITDTINYILGK